MISDMRVIGPSCGPSEASTGAPAVIWASAAGGAGTADDGVGGCACAADSEGAVVVLVGSMIVIVKDDLPGTRIYLSSRRICLTDGRGEVVMRGRGVPPLLVENGVGGPAPLHTDRRAGANRTCGINLVTGSDRTPGPRRSLGEPKYSDNGQKATQRCCCCCRRR